MEPRVVLFIIFTFNGLLLLKVDVKIWLSKFSDSKLNSKMQKMEGEFRFFFNKRMKGDSMFMIRIIMKLQDVKCTSTSNFTFLWFLSVMSLLFVLSCVLYVLHNSRGEKKPMFSLFRRTTSLLKRLPATPFTRNNVATILSVPLQIKSLSPSFQTQVRAHSQPDLHKEGGF